MKKRNIQFENKLCKAIKDRHTVKLRYRDEPLDRLYDPFIVYRSPLDRVVTLVHGFQQKNENKPMDHPAPKTFHVSLISEIFITDATFNFDFRFNPLDQEYRNGVICAVKPIGAIRVN